MPNQLITWLQCLQMVVTPACEMSSSFANSDSNFSMSANFVAPSASANKSRRPRLLSMPWTHNRLHCIVIVYSNTCRNDTLTAYFHIYTVSELYPDFSETLAELLDTKQLNLCTFDNHEKSSQAAFHKTSASVTHSYKWKYIKKHQKLSQMYSKGSVYNINFFSKDTNNVKSAK